MKGVKATFDNFIPGEENRVTYLAAQRIAHAEPGSLFNPFYIYGDIGTGKTHLLEATVAAIREKFPGFNVVSEKIGNIVEELKTTSFDDIRKRWQEANYLILDDIHYLNRLEEEKDRFTQLLITLFNRDVQLIISGRFPPKDLKLDEHFVSIIESGLVTSLSPPKEMTRLEILKKMCEIRGVILTDEIFAELARIPFKSVRELEGALNRVLAYSSIGEIAMDRNLLMMALKEYYQEKQTEPVVTSFLAEVSEEVDRALAEVESEEAIRKQFEEKIYIWNMKGFRTDAISDLLDGDIETLKKAYEEFVQKVEKLIDLQREYGSIDLSNNPELALKIEALLFDPERIDELTRLIEEAKGALPVVKFGFSFDDMIVGECNRIPVELAHKAIEKPGQEINPLTFIGKSGTGKTSLLWAIGNDIVVRNPTLTVEYLDLRHPKGEFHTPDILLLDNLDECPPERRKELLDLLKEMMAQNRQIFIATTTPPLRLGWPDFDRQIFEEGVEAELKPPDPKTAAEYIRAKGGEPPTSLPCFDSFYDLERYFKFEAIPIPLGLPGEEEITTVRVDEKKLIFPKDLDDYLLDEEVPWQ
ncbi:hypothetical protein DRP53_02220 [candidate division WOR-3 bacterium]|uniref:Chromosomal replication initiator protein DnaA n=1 Tax=candidate division WOR-3 bacterium TaxID=2052148 RepID=A0A660SK84_UNCW3|nr:MAG: hypothetical protein DRP53_02220 [candidate division WOR-3 bacterium]